jgi:hypothetical protein
LVPTLEYLSGRGHAEAAAWRGRIAALALAERAAREGRDAPRSVEAYLADLSRRTVCLTFLAGAGTRWRKSVAAAAEGAPGRGAGAGSAARRLDPERPRGLYPVRDFLRPGGGELPIAAYAIAATGGLGRRVIIARGWEREIDEEILAPLGVGPSDREFFEQAAPGGSPLGHGDAAWQCRSLWSGADYVVANFGGDASSRVTALSALLTLDALASAGVRADFLLPAARFDSPAYPIELDADGLPRGFGHAKLRGRAEASGPGYANVGLRLYRAGALLEKVECIRSKYWKEGEGYSIPGNDPAGREFALDNADALLAAEGRARVLAAAMPEELTPVKSIDDVPAFEAAVERVVASDAAAAAPAGAR